MSQPRSSIDPLSPPTVSEEEMIRRVEEYCAQDAPPTPRESLREFFRDPFSKDDDHYRPNPLWVSVTIFFLISCATFLYFSFRSF